LSWKERLAPLLPILEAASDTPQTSVA
jgi:hypothetical protein